MDSDLRRRTTGSMAAHSQEDPSSGTGLSAPRMLQASPQHSGKLMKLHTSPIYMVLPSFIQKCIAWLLPFLRPTWKNRYAIVLGSYFYKFQDEKSVAPKGSPVPLESIDAYILADSSSSETQIFPTLPAGYSVLVVATFRKRYYYAAESREEALLWVNTIRDAKHEAHRRSMGHVPQDSFPKAWNYFDVLGGSLVKSKERIRKRVEEMEMKSLTGDNPLTRGVYG